MDVYNQESMKLGVSVQYTHGNKYTKKWIGYVQRIDTGGGFSLSDLYNGGRFNSEAEIHKAIDGLEKDGYIVVSIDKVKEITF